MKKAGEKLRTYQIILFYESTKDVEKVENYKTHYIKALKQRLADLQEGIANGRMVTVDKGIIKSDGDFFDALIASSKGDPSHVCVLNRLYQIDGMNSFIRE